ncbi:amidohydrolase family protein [Candidatus Palauibacter soopunensis]|uniref:N-acyl-D-amino-acid deacylase family protein n=1 Tax=Candidatus Palauibacter soopunensis TaxID=3056739 RepID=UPI0023A1AAC6|nr:amidohydrolase family protein [Candidatus Palauibacter soopunensis]MDE2879980.1 amidohydrolase family protein [Candidatus Palauibacter soopunensis]
MKRSDLRTLLLSAVLGFLHIANAAAQEPAFDILLRGGRVLDGTGNPWFRADVGIRDGRILRVGDLADATADRMIELDGRYVVPGFIDIHSHADQGLDAEGDAGSEGARRRAAPNLVSQGITTVVINQDGGGQWPISDQRGRLESRGHGPNAALMVGHNTIRRMALGDDFMRPSTPAEVERMTEMVEQGMAEGAYGLSAGLEYVPGIWSETSELFPLVEAAGRGGGIYIVHERSSGMTPMWFWPSQDDPGPPTMIQTVLEDIEVAERTGVTTVATHIKARGADFWGAGRALVDLIERARARGVPIFADQYPYNTTGSDGSTVLLPRWIFPGGGPGGRPGGQEAVDYAAVLTYALSDPERGERVRLDIAHEISRRGGPENLVIMDHPDETLVGKTVAELSAEWDAFPVEVAIRLQLEGDRARPGGARVRGFSLSEIDVEEFSAHPWLVTASDAGISLLDDGPVHARFYGTFPRKIKRYAMDLGILSVESAVRSMTSLPAQVMGLRDRGLIREGMVADIAVLDLDELQDNATFFEPHQYASGVDYVLVGGTFVVDAGRLTWALPGAVLTPEADDES